VFCVGVCVGVEVDIFFSFFSVFPTYLQVDQTPTCGGTSQERKKRSES